MMTGLVPMKQISQSRHDNGTTLNISPPIVTIKNCPTKIITRASSKPPNDLDLLIKAEAPVWKALALKRFQN